MFAPFFTANDIYPNDFFYYNLGTLYIHLYVVGALVAGVKVFRL